jgi:hypothetical protein
MQVDSYRPIRALTTSGSNFTTLGKVCLTPAIPAVKSLAAQIPGYLEWESAKGAYVAARMVRPPRPVHFQCKNAGNLTVTSQNSVGIVTESNKVSNTLESWSVPGSGSTVAYVTTLQCDTPPSFDSGFQPFAIHLSGLSATSSFRCVLRTVVEYFPEVTDGQALANAIVATTSDPVAFLDYHRTRSVLPVAVPVGMNAKGDWWRMVKSGFKTGLQIASGVLPMLGFPDIGKAAGIIYSASGAPLVGPKPPPLPPRPNRPPKPKNKKGKNKNS